MAFTTPDLELILKSVLVPCCWPCLPWKISENTCHLPGTHVEEVHFPRHPNTSWEYLWTLRKTHLKHQTSEVIWMSRVSEPFGKKGAPTFGNIMNLPWIIPARTRDEPDLQSIMAMMSPFQSYPGTWRWRCCTKVGFSVEKYLVVEPTHLIIWINMFVKLDHETPSFGMTIT